MINVKGGWGGGVFFPPVWCPGVDKIHENDTTPVQSSALTGTRWSDSRASCSVVAIFTQFKHKKQLFPASVALATCQEVTNTREEQPFKNGKRSSSLC